MPPPRVLIVTLSLAVGGTERHIVDIAPRLAAKGFDVTVLLLLGRGELAPELEARGVRVVAPPPVWPALPFGAMRLLAEMLLRRPAIVHFFLPLAYLVGAPMALLLRIPVRIMSRRSQNDYQRRHPLLAHAERWLHRHMTALLVNSARVGREMEEETTARDRIHLIHNGVDLERFRGPFDRIGERAKLGIPREALVLAVVANLIPYKGHSDLIAALGAVREQLPEPWHLLVIGRDDGIGQSLRQQAEAAGIGGNIHWLGKRSDVPGLLSASDIGVLVSHEEGFSNAVIEGMAAGLPMVVTDVGGNGDAIGQGEAGVLVPPGEPVALAEAILELAGDPARSARLGAAGRARVAAHYALEACAERYEQLYRGLLRA